MAEIKERKDFDENLLNEKSIPQDIDTSGINILNTAVENTKGGALSKDLRIARNGKIIALSQVDWDSYPIDNFSYSSENVVTVTGIDTIAEFQIGEKVRILQNDGTKYFYIIGVDEMTLTLDAGTDYTLTEGSINEFSTSDLDNPLGHPVWFNYSPLLSVPGGSSLSISAQGTSDAAFSISNGNCFVTSSRTGATIGGAGPSVAVLEDLPIEANMDNISRLSWVIYVVNSGTASVPGSGRILNTDTEHLEIFSISSGGYAHDYSVWYPII